MKKQSKTLNKRLRNSINNEVLVFFDLNDWIIESIFYISDNGKD
jgi:hypothetical protein